MRSPLARDRCQPPGFIRGSRPITACERLRALLCQGRPLQTADHRELIQPVARRSRCLGSLSSRSLLQGEVLHLIHRQEMFASCLAALSDSLFVKGASSIGIWPHANHPPPPQHYWVIGLGQSYKCTTILPLRRSG
jgi:hypothetical protein